MSRKFRCYWRACYRLNIHRGSKLRMSCTVEEHEEADVCIRMLRNHHGLDRTANPCAWPDDFPRARRTHGWKNHKHRHQWERRVRQLEKRERSNARKHRTDRPEERSMPMNR